MSNNRGWNSSKRQYRSTNAQQQLYANAVQQNIRQSSRSQYRNEPRIDANVIYIGQRFNNQRRDEHTASFNIAHQSTDSTRRRTFGQNRSTPSQRQYITICRQRKSVKTTHIPKTLFKIIF